jgi:hypothetical protein
MRAGVYLLGLALLLVGCAANGKLGAAPATQGPFTLTVWNRSQFELLELHVHGSSGYQNTDNELEAPPLGLEAKIDLEVYTGNYFTVVRQRIDVGEEMALTTATPVSLGRDGYTLIVFDESFRLMNPGSLPAE